MPPDVIVVDDRLLQSGSALAVMTGAQLIVVGVDDDPGFATRARRLRRRLGREGARRDAAARAVGLAHGPSSCGSGSAGASASSRRVDGIRATRRVPSPGARGDRRARRRRSAIRSRIPTRPKPSARLLGIEADAVIGDLDQHVARRPPPGR